jgi:hypothetical protein
MKFCESGLPEEKLVHPGIGEAFALRASFP